MKINKITLLVILSMSQTGCSDLDSASYSIIKGMGGYCLEYYTTSQIYDSKKSEWINGILKAPPGKVELEKKWINNHIDKVHDDDNQDSLTAISPISGNTYRFYKYCTVWQ